MSVNLLTDSMRSDGWRMIGDEPGWVMWVHAPTGQVVSIDAGQRKTWVGPTWGPEPESPDAPGYTVTLRVHDEGGDPVTGDGFWVESPFLARRLAERIRKSVLAGHVSPARPGGLR